MVGAGSSFHPPGRHQNAALQWKPLAQADTAAAASRKAPSVSDGGGVGEQKLRLINNHIGNLLIN